MHLLGVDPARGLVEGLGGHGTTEDLVHLRRRLGDRRDCLLELSHKLGVIKDATRDLAVATTQAKHKVESRLLLDVVVRQGAAILKLLASEDQALLVGRDALLVLDLCLDVIDGVGWLHLKRDGLAGERLDEDLHVDVL